MRFKIKEIGDEGLSLDLPVTGAWLASQLPDLDATLGPRGIRVRGRLVGTENGDVFLRATLRGALDTVCARCLEKAVVPLDVPLVVTFTSGAETASEDADSNEEDEGVNVTSFDGDHVDIGAEIRDQISLALPLKPLCREDCAGLCAFCGKNRNQFPCDCQARETLKQPLAAALQKLKTQN